MSSLMPRSARASSQKAPAALAAKEGLTLVEDEALLAENAGLTEWPVVLMGSFDEGFLDVPQEVLTTSMKAHQKCFSLRKRGGKLANRFIMVANLEAEDGGKAIVAGNERVIARAALRRQVLLRPGPQGDAAGPRAEAEGDRLPREARQPI